MLKVKKVLRIISNILSFIILTFSSVILCLSYYITKYLKGISFYEIEYLLKSSQTGTDYSIVYSGVKACIIIFLVVLILLYFPITNSKKRKISIEFKKSRKELKLYPNIFNTHKVPYSLFLLSLSLIILLNTVSFTEYVENKNSTTEIYDKYYIDSNDVKIKFKEKRNLIFIIAESMESSLFTETNNGTFLISRIPELENLAKENTNFSNTETLGGGLQLYGTGFTIAGTVASTSGVPLKWHQSSEGEEFNKNIRSLGDILKEEGYNLEHIQGSDASFGDTDKYFKTHGNYYLYDYKEAKNQNFISSNYYENWGFEDKKLFELAKEEILGLYETQKPFAVSLSTMDTHFIDGYLDETCETPFEDQMSNVYNCNSKMINNFVSWIKSQDFYKDTVIVIVGDHLSMQSEYYKDYQNYERKIYNVFINSAQKEHNTKNRQFSNLDIFPTILASMGAEIEGNQLGFGVNLYSDRKTMIEVFGKEEFEKEINKKTDYFEQRYGKEFKQNTKSDK